MTNNGKQQIVLNFTLVVIVLVWAASVLFDALDPNYSSPTGINEIFMIVAAFVFGAKGINKAGNGAPKK